MATNFPWYWSERMHQKWQRLRAHGFAHFVLVRGVLGWGGSMFLVFAVLSVVFAASFDAKLSLPDVLLRVGLPCLVGGFGWGIVTWYGNEWLYRKHSDGAP